MYWVLHGSIVKGDEEKMNQCVITGRLVKDPEFHEVNSEKGNFHIATFVLAVRRNHSDGASFIKVKLFGTHADLANERLSKGMKVLVSGELLTGSYISKQTNQKVYTTELSGSWMEIEAERDDYPPKVPDDIAEEFMKIPEGLEEELPFR